MELIETIELGSSQSSITFSSIPQDYDDLVVLFSARGESSSDNPDMAIRFNSTNSGYSYVNFFGSGSSVGSNSNYYGTDKAQFGFFNFTNSTANTFSNTKGYISNYKTSSAKSFSVDAVTENNSTLSYQNLIAGLWNNAAAITSITLFAALGYNLSSGSTFSLYGISAG